MPSTKNLKPLKEQPTTKPGYHPDGDELKVWNQYLRRKNELLGSRRNVYGQDIDMIMRRMDTNYFNRVANIPASELDADQAPLAINNAFGKVQSALGLLIDRNPEIVLEESNPRYTANRELIKGLAKASWKNTNSLGQLKLSIYNCAKRGWFVGRTFHRSLKHDARFLSRIEDDYSTPDSEDAAAKKPVEAGKKVYDTQQITKMDDVAYVNLNNFNTWIDEQTVPEDFLSTRDWMWREVWDIEDVKRIFPKVEFPNMENVVEGGDTRETVYGVTNANTGSQTTANEAKETKKGMTELFFYENQYDDWFIVEIHGVMVCWEPLPQNSKRLSCVYGQWNLRGAETIYGVGIVEEMERNEQLIDRILNMTLRQLLLTIAPPGFFTGTEDPEDDNLKYKPGVLRRTMDPKNITFLEIPNGNENGLKVIDWLENKQDQMTGITKGLEGDPQATPGENDTAFALGVNREAGLKRLRLPLKSIQYALDWEFRNRIDLIKQVYSDFQVQRLSGKEEIDNYLDEINADPDFFFIRNEKTDKEEFYKKSGREMQLNLEQDEQGNFVESEDKKFFKIKQKYLAFEGDVTVDVNSMLIQSEELEKADTLRLSNIVVPLFAQPPELVARPVKQMLTAFNKDPRKWLPDAWLQYLEQGGSTSKKTKTPPKLPVTEEKPMDMKAETIVPPSNLENAPSFGSRASAAFKAFKNPGQ